MCPCKKPSKHLFMLVRLQNVLFLLPVVPSRYWPPESHKYISDLDSSAVFAFRSVVNNGTVWTADDIVQKLSPCTLYMTTDALKLISNYHFVYTFAPSFPSFICSSSHAKYRTTAALSVRDSLIPQFRPIFYCFPMIGNGVSLTTVPTSVVSEYTALL